MSESSARILRVTFAGHAGSAGYALHVDLLDDL